ncbi:hypothetical protein LCGC14_0772720 [marine sediment metagenome]|uniref:CDP-glycerol:poly(Glycerophosphate) glycerophosphotransferase n=1 Tax=marine sediment metagenome TaxID=412755 RepID=A0A0F9SHU7_9ZZZZ
MTLNGLFLDPRIWKIDFLPSPFWKPEKYGVNIELHPNAFNIPKLGLNKKYDFVIATEVWELPIQKTLEYLRNKGMKIILVPRELAPGKTHKATMFADERFKYKNQYHCIPDLVLAPGERYCSMWRDKVESKIIGYPRFDIYLRPDLWPSRESIIEKHGLENDKKIIYFPSYPPYHVETIDGKNTLIDAYDDLQNTMRALEQYAIKHQDKVQVVVKIHPMAMKCYRKKTGPGREVSGLMEKYYKQPTKFMRVVGDERLNSSSAREMIMVSDLVIGYVSMMMLEAVANNKPVVHVLFEQSRQLKNALEFHHDMYTVRDPEEVEAALDLGLYTDKLIVKDSKALEYVLYKIDGKFTERLCTEIKRVCKG